MNDEEMVRILKVASNDETLNDTLRLACGYAAERLDVSPVPPVMVSIPFSWAKELQCGFCGAKISAEQSKCVKCGKAIAWHSLRKETDNGDDTLWRM